MNVLPQSLVFHDQKWDSSPKFASMIHHVLNLRGKRLYQNLVILVDQQTELQGINTMVNLQMTFRRMIIGLLADVQNRMIYGEI